MKSVAGCCLRRIAPLPRPGTSWSGFRAFWRLRLLYLAYLDEFGHIGPFLGHADPRHKTHPVFGLGGLLLPYFEVRRFSTFFFQLKNQLLNFELTQSGVHPAKWEKKGSSLYTIKNIGKYRELRQATFRILKKIRAVGGFAIYVGVEKRRDVKAHDSKKLYHTVLREVIKRIDQECELRRAQFLLILDEQEENVMRHEIVETASVEMFGPNSRSRLLEPPVEAESHLYQTIQCADWLCGLYGRLSYFECDPEGRPENAIAEKYFGTRVRDIVRRSSIRRLT